MIGRLTGTVVERGEGGSCVVDVQGVGYEVAIPVSLAGRLPAPPETVTLWVHTHVREDAFTLFGFGSEQDRAAFRTLLTVSSVGPKLALAVLSQLGAHALAAAVTRGDKNALRGIPGVGPKIVERVLLELKDKLHVTGAPEATATPQVAAARVESSLDKVARLLVGMGYKPFEAEQAVSKLQGQDEARPVEALLRDALAAMQ